MKPRNQNPLNLAARSSKLLGLCTITFCVLSVSPAAHAATAIWDGLAGAPGNWNADNWSGGGGVGGAPVANDILTFGGATETSTTNNFSAGTTFNGINFTNNVTISSGQFTLAGNSIVLGGDIVTTAPAVVGSNIITDTISLNIALSGNRTFNVGRIAANGNHNLIVSGEISGGFNLTKTGAASLTLSNTNNSFSGTFNVTGNNDVNLGSIQAAGTNSSIGSGSVINMSSGNLIVNGNVSSGNINRTINLTNTGTATYKFENNNATAANFLVFTSPITNASTSGTTTFTLAGTNTGVNEFRTAVVNGTGTNITSLSKTGTGRWILGAAGSYTGTTAVSGGVLQLNVASALPSGALTLSGGVLGLGAENFTRALGTGTNQVALTSNGSGFAAYGADRIVNFASAPSSLIWNGTSGTSGFFSNSNLASELVLGSATSTHTVDFQNSITLSGIRFFRTENGAALVDGRLSGAITGSTSFSKAGTGTLELTNTSNAWTSTTFIDSGTLRLGAAGVIPNGSSVIVKRGSAAGNSSGVLDLNGFNETITGLTLGEAGTDATNIGQTPSVVNSGGAATLTLGGNITYEAGNPSFLNGQATISANLNTGGVARTIDVKNGSAAEDLLISGKLSGAGTITKTGAGTLALSSISNDYTGATNVNVGTLVVNGSISTSTLTTVASTATISGAGTTGALTVASGGFINPGNSPGTLNVNGNYTQAGLYTAEITGLTAGTQHDQINVAGTVNITGGTLATIFTGSYSLNDILFILRNDSTDAITGTYTGLTQGAVAATFGGFDWEISYLGDSGTSSFLGGNDIALRAVPEPNAAVLVGGLGMLALPRRRRA